MAKVSGKYEAMYILDAALAEDAIAALVEKFKSLVEQNGTLTEVNEWGKRRLAYPIDHKNEGYYVLMTFEAGPAFPAELGRNFNITDGVIRSMVVDLGE
ncbi:MAG TPA: 30S ribosomal protein S6 [Candidatus Onthomonas avicola]|nr:30S ribosomal protein S6 [Candidatus Onthomonas avicola]